MREMKDSGVKWIGEIPIEWEICKLKNIASIQTGNTPPKNIQSTFYSDESGTPWIKAEDLGKRDSISETKEYLTEDGKKEGRIFPANTVFVCCIASIGKTGFSEQECSCNQQINGIIFNRMQWKYGYYMTLAQESEYIFNASGNVMKIINTEKQGDLRCPLPTKCDQERIVNYLDSKCSKIDESIEAHQAIIEKLKEYKLSVITEAVTKGINPNVEMKESGIEWIGKIPIKWNVGKTLYALSMPITDGPHETPELFDKGIPFVSAEAVSCGNGVIDFEHIRGYISQEFYEECCKKYVPQINDIYMIKSGATTGKVAIVDTDRKFTIWSPLAVFRCNPNKMNYMYLLYFLQSDVYQKQVQDKWTYGTQQNIGMRSLEKLFVCFPSLDEQRNIADYLNEQCIRIEKNINERKLIIQKLKEYKKSLIYEVVTGKKEV